MEPVGKKVERREEDAPAPLSAQQWRRITSGHRGLKLLVLGQAVAIVLLFCLVAGTIAQRWALL